MTGEKFYRLTFSTALHTISFKTSDVKPFLGLGDSPIPT
jgi:hypothetical protein